METPMSPPHSARLSEPYWTPRKFSSPNLKPTDPQFINSARTSATAVSRGSRRTSNVSTLCLSPDNHDYMSVDYSLTPYSSSRRGSTLSFDPTTLPSSPTMLPSSPTMLPSSPTTLPRSPSTIFEYPADGKQITTTAVKTPQSPGTMHSKETYPFVPPNLYLDVLEHIGDPNGSFKTDSPVTYHPSAAVDMTPSQNPYSWNGREELLPTIHREVNPKNITTKGNLDMYARMGGPTFHDYMMDSEFPIPKKDLGRIGSCVYEDAPGIGRLQVAYVRNEGSLPWHPIVSLPKMLPYDFYQWKRRTGLLPQKKPLCSKNIFSSWWGKFWSGLLDVCSACWNPIIVTL